MEKIEISPFVKWAGGKSQLLNTIMMQIPAEYDTYYEPFVGGGAVLFGLQPKKAVICDVNAQLVNVYKQLQKNVDSVIEVINGIGAVECSKEYYYEMRDLYNEKIKSNVLDEETAGLFIWLNKHCFNGLYRVNGKGLFNVPFNNNKSGKACDERNLHNIGHYLCTNDVKIVCGDFLDVCKMIGKNDFVYFDSPYVPISPTASFTDYTKDGFSYEDHLRLAREYKRISEVGIRAMLSNHDVELVRNLYGQYKIESIEVKRNINSKAEKRTGKEVIVTNY